MKTLLAATAALAFWAAPVPAQLPAGPADAAAKAAADAKATGAAQAQEAKGAARAEGAGMKAKGVQKAREVKGKARDKASGKAAATGALQPAAGAAVQQGDAKGEKAIDAVAK